MASDVDISNLALAHLGDAAVVVSIDPVDGSPQSAHCARFYPIARDALLEGHLWGFATSRTSLALLATNPTSTWKYAYAAPADMLNSIAVLDPNATDDYSVGVSMAGVGPNSIPVIGLGVYTPQPYAMEKADDGTDMILTNQVDAVLRYTARVTDPSKFTPLFTLTLSHLMASMLAGPILKGDAGRAEAKAQLQIASEYQRQAEGSDANQRVVKPPQGAIWMTNR